MSRFLYWTIVLGTEPTSFRAAEAEELLPTLTQLRRKHPDASLRWFQRGRLWISPDDAKAALSRERADAKGRPATWRPGGKHVDPRQKYIDAKKAKWTKFKSAIRERAESRREARGDHDGASRPERPREQEPRDERPIAKTEAPAAPPATPPARRDWRIEAETGDAPRLIKKPIARRPQPEEPEPPPRRENRPFADRKPRVDRERSPAFGDRKAPFDRERRPAFNREGGERPPRKTFDRDARPPFNREGGERPPRKSFDRDARPPFNREGGERPPRKTFDRDARPPFNREGGDRPPRKTFDRDTRPPFNRGGGDRPPRKTFDRDARPPFNREGGERPPRKSFDRDARPPFNRESSERPPRKPAFDRDREGSRPPGPRKLADWKPKSSGDRPPGGGFGGGKPGDRRGPGGPKFGGPKFGGGRPPGGPRGPRKPKP